MIYDNILGTIGRTPIVKINRLAPAGTTMYAKCEFFNPLSSVKDRLAIAIIEDAERNGTLKPGQTVVEAILKVQSVDLVADPATTHSLFESAADAQPEGDERLAGLTLESLRAARPDLVEAIRADAAAPTPARE